MCVKKSKANLSSGQSNSPKKTWRKKNKTEKNKYFDLLVVPIHK